jgi:alanine racemase
VRPTYAVIDLGAIRHNVLEFIDLIAPSALCVVVKADAYGHGDVPVAQTAQDAGAPWLAVALVEEGVRLREAGIETPILVLSEPGPEAAAEIVKWALTPTVYSPRFVQALGETSARLGIQVKVDSGMHRVGIDPSGLGALLTAVGRYPALEVTALWSHFAVADEDPDFTRLQIQRFTETVQGLQGPMRHIANTAGAVLHPDARFDMCRVGLGIYGLHPSSHTRSTIALKPAMSIVSHTSHVRSLQTGARPSYGRIRPLESDGLVATVPIGYADGYPRRLSHHDLALVGGRRRRLAGTVTMDQIVLDMTGSFVEVGDEVVLLGRQGDTLITAEDWAEALGTISYEVVCGIGPRVPRRYVE